MILWHDQVISEYLYVGIVVRWMSRKWCGSCIPDSCTAGLVSMNFVFHRLVSGHLGTSCTPLTLFWIVKALLSELFPTGRWWSRRGIDSIIWDVFGAQSSIAACHREATAEASHLHYLRNYLLGRELYFAKSLQKNLQLRCQLTTWTPRSTKTWSTWFMGCWLPSHLMRGSSPWMLASSAKLWRSCG